MRLNLIWSLLLATLTTIVFTSCSSDIDHRERHPLSSRYVKVTGQVGELSRATANSWEAGDCIGISGGDYSNVKYVTEGGTGTFTAAGTAIETAVAEKREFTAYYPYAASVSTGISFNVVDGEDRYTSTPSAIDFMWAKATASDAAVNFAFGHCMSSLRLTLVVRYLGEDGAEIQRPDGMEAVTSAAVNITNVITTGLFNTVTGDMAATGGTGSILADVPVSGTTLILPPQTLAEDMEVTSTFAGKQYRAVIRPALKPGYQYSYTLTYSIRVLPQEPPVADLTVSQASIAAWTEGTGGDAGFTSPDDAVEGPGQDVTPEVPSAAVGDFLLTDGTVLPASGYTSDRKNDVAAVIYYIAGDRKELPGLGFPNPNGLAISVYGVEDSKFATAPGATLKYLGVGQQDDSWTAGTRALWLSSCKDSSGSDAVPTRMSGYANTQMFRYIDTNGYCKEGSATFLSSTNKVDGIIAALDKYDAAHRFTSSAVSSWYIPSYAEFKEIEANLETINASFSRLNSSLYYHESSKYGSFIWTSDERDSSRQWGWVTGETGAYDRTDTKGSFHFAVSF